MRFSSTHSLDDKEYFLVQSFSTRKSIDLLPDDAVAIICFYVEWFSVFWRWNSVSSVQHQNHIPCHLGREYVSREKKLTMVNFLIFVQKNVSTIRFQEIKIRPFRDFEKKAFFSLFLMRKRLSSGQKWFLRPYFPLIRGMFLLKSGLWFSFRALEVPEPRVRKRPY